ncbi:glycoside hydrolase family 9 protein [Ideonella sp. DXS29W]|uniref:Glycoside hydrolase family 9 protein n=1 Tax=Ideonella lacteola TaxID=2984193 RepID=A0ABU9BSF5_9BURK
MKILHNHLGYRAAAPSKRVLLQASSALPGDRFVVYHAEERRVVFEGAWQALGPVQRWRDWQYWAAEFGELRVPGRYVVAVPGTDLPLQSQPFAIAQRLYDPQHVSDLLHYIKSQRCGGMFDAADRACPIHRDDAAAPERLDVHGGWYDASGDASKYLTHLSYANHLNPQQTPQVVWNLLETRSRLADPGVWMADRLVDEALHGADFLCRMLHPDGYFCQTVFDQWSKDAAQRRLCAYATQKGHLLATVQAGFRQGAGSAIAALARASDLPRSGAFHRSAYLAAAERAFAHLVKHNVRYLPDGRENIIDDYCALLAAAELCAATGGRAIYSAAVRHRSERLLARQHADGWFWADDAKTRSFTHAVEAGLPYVALLRTLEACPGVADDDALRTALDRGLKWEMAITAEGENNPFHVPRQFVQRPGQPGRVQFFMPHDNETGYWWQGENARLASLAAAALWSRRALRQRPEGPLQAYADATLDWIFGRNPFDICMMQGAGNGPAPRYEPRYWNAPGGVCNGITAGLDDEEDIDFRRPSQTDPMHSWRWTEQWLPHGAWLMLALAFAQA